MFIIRRKKQVEHICELSLSYYKAFTPSCWPKLVSQFNSNSNHSHPNNMGVIVDMQEAESQKLNLDEYGYYEIVGTYQLCSL